MQATPIHRIHLYAGAPSSRLRATMRNNTSTVHAITAAPVLKYPEPPNAAKHSHRVVSFKAPPQLISLVGHWVQQVRSVQDWRLRYLLPSLRMCMAVPRHRDNFAF